MWKRGEVGTREGWGAWVEQGLARKMRFCLFGFFGYKKKKKGC